MATLTTSYQQIASKYIGTVSGSGVSAKDLYLRIYAKYTSQSIEDNKSYVSYKSTLYITGEGTYFYTGNTTTKTLSGTGATTVNADAQGNYYVGETTLCETTGTVAHNSSGIANVSITTGWSSVPWGISGSLTATADLPTIARSTNPTFSATSVEMGKSITITLNPATSSFKHKVSYAFGSLTEQTSGVSIGSGFSAAGNVTVTFTPPTSLGSQIPSATSGVCKVTCSTYKSDGALVGSVTSNITLTIPSYTPTITGITLTGYNLLSSAYVKGKSTVTVNATVGTSYGANTKSIKTVIDEKEYLNLPFTTSVLSNGTKTAKITFTDTRDKSVTVESSAITVYDYAIPNITDFTLARQSDGTTVIATIKGSISAINNKNTKTIKITLNGVTNTVTSSAYTINATTTFTNVPTDQTLTGKAIFTDSYTSVEKIATLPTVAVTMDFYKDGNGIAMGKVAEQSDLLDVAWRIKNNSVPSLIGGLGNSIPSNANLNSTSYINPGNYVCPSNAIAQTLTNTPTKNAFKMCVHNVTNSYADASNQWTYLVREITNYQGERWVQDVNKDTGSWVYSAWRLVVNSGNISGYMGDYIKPYIKDYITEQGTYSDGWEYIKWANGRIELWADKSITFPEPTNMGNYLWRSIYSLDMSSKLKSIISGTCCVQYSGILPTFSRHSTTLTMGEIVVATSKSFTSFTTVVPIYIIGKWK